MGRIAPPPIRTGLLDKLGNISQNWTDWIRSLRLVGESALDMEVLSAFSDLNEGNTVGARIDDAARFSAFDAVHVPDLSAVLLDLERLERLHPDRSWSELRGEQDTFANRGLYPAAAMPDGSFFRATDYLVIWQKRIVSGTPAWVYVAGIWRDTLSNIPTASLGTNDAGLLFEATDYSHLLRWTGSAWAWAPGERGSGEIAFFLSSPAGMGASAWHVCDGSTVARLNADGTTTNVALPDYSTAAYLKAATATTAGPTASSGRTSSDSAGTPAGTNSAPDTGNDTDAGFKAQADAAGTLVALNPHLHHTTAPVFTGSALAGHDHGPNTLELRHTALAAYFRC